MPTTLIVPPFLRTADFNALTDSSRAKVGENFDGSVETGYAGKIWPSLSIQTRNVSGGMCSAFQTCYDIRQRTSSIKNEERFLCFLFCVILNFQRSCKIYGASIQNEED